LFLPRGALGTQEKLGASAVVFFGAMSYSTLSRNLDPIHTYTSTKAEKFIPGVWWPDFGPLTADYSYQIKMHPTNTIHENLFEKQNQAPAQSGARDAPLTVFRRQPTREALYNSTIIQPYRKGGRPEGLQMDKRDPQRAALRECPTLSKLSQTTDLVQLSKSIRSCRSGVASPTSVMGRASSSSAIGSMCSNSDEDGAPTWLARRTIISRPPDAAGQAASSRFANHSKGPTEVSFAGTLGRSTRSLSLLP
jgi:hypothetical protein